MDQERVVALFKNEDFTKKVLALTEAEDVQTAFKAEGVDLTLEEVKVLGKIVESKLSGKELSDDELEDVAGGCGLVATAVIFGISLAISIPASIGLEIGLKKGMEKLSKLDW